MKSLLWSNLKLLFSGIDRVDVLGIGSLNDGGNGDDDDGLAGAGTDIGGGRFIGGIENPEFPSSICASETLEISKARNIKICFIN